MGDLPRYFKFVRLMLTSSLKILNAFLDPFKRRTLHESWKDKSVISQPGLKESMRWLGKRSIVPLRHKIRICNLKNYLGLLNISNGRHNTFPDQWTENWKRSAYSNFHFYHKKRFDDGMTP